MEISNTAVSEFKRILVEENSADGAIKIFRSEGGCCGPSFGISITKSGEGGDDFIEKDGLKVFAEKAVLQDLEGATIDFINEGDQGGFIISGNSCGEGCSCC